MLCLLCFYVFGSWINLLTNVKLFIEMGHVLSRKRTVGSMPFFADGKHIVSLTITTVFFSKNNGEEHGGATLWIIG